MKGETRFVEWFRKRLDRIPGLYHMKTQMVALRGVPDIFACKNGRMIALEMKDGDDEPTKAQGRVLYHWRKAGAYARGVNRTNAEEVLGELERL